MYLLLMSCQASWDCVILLSVFQGCDQEDQKSNQKKKGGEENSHHTLEMNRMLKILRI